MKYAYVKNVDNTIQEIREFPSDFSPSTLDHKFGPTFDIRIIPFNVDADIEHDRRIYKQVSTETVHETEVRVTKELVALPTDKFISRIISQINAKTSEIIEAGIEIKGVQVKLDDYRQADFNALETAHLGGNLTFPYTIWEGDTDIVIEENEMTPICLTVMEFIYTQRRIGQQLRKSISELTQEQLLNWEDPR